MLMDHLNEFLLKNSTIFYHFVLEYSVHLRNLRESQLQLYGRENISSMLEPKVLWPTDDNEKREYLWFPKRLSWILRQVT